MYDMGKLKVKKDGNKFGLVDDCNNTYIVEPIFDEITEDERTGFLFAYKGSRLYRIVRRYYKPTASFFDVNDQMKYLTITM